MNNMFFYFTISFVFSFINCNNPCSNSIAKYCITLELYCNTFDIL